MKKLALVSLVAILISANVFAQFTHIDDTPATSNNISMLAPSKYSNISYMFQTVNGFDNISSDTTRSYFIIEKPFGHSTYEGVRIRKIKTADMKKILYPNTKAYKKYNESATLNVLGSLLLIGGGVATFVNTSAAASGETFDPQANAISLGLTISSVPFFIWARGLQKKAILIYNED
jgi:hypothetical protein